MSEGPQASSKPKMGVLTWALWGAALVGVAAVVYIIGQASSNPDRPKVATVPIAGPPAFASKVTTPTQPTSPPDLAFTDAAGKSVRIADFKGKVVVMNIWATWCGPCKVEMPTLAKLQAAYAGKGVEVMPISIDEANKAQQAALFIAQNAPLKFYLDGAMKLPFKLNPPAVGTPTTVIYGKDGLEVARVTGDADWSSPEAKALIDKALAAS
ncbi:MAG: TlpA family protein disulfide reductase [Caulobacterales bacterium]|nr:TlpA family protein disulfide reductase [Caulobacterales bacterium]